MKTLRAGIAILAAVALSVSAQAGERPKTIYVEGDDLPDAIDKAPPHSVLLADRGRQIEITATVRITKPVTLVGLNARLKPGLGKTPILEVLAEGFRIRDFLLEGNADSVEQKQRAPLIVIRRGRFVVENGETNNSAKDGVMITPVAEYGDIEHGVIRDLTSRGTIRDTVSIGGAGDLGLFVRHLVVSNIRAYDSELRAPPVPPLPRLAARRTRFALSAHPREEPPRAIHVGSILVAEAFDQLLLFRPCTDDDEGDRQSTGQGQEPVGSDEGIGNDCQCSCHIERMADPPIRAGRDQRVLRPRYDGVGEIGAETAECPDQ